MPNLFRVPYIDSLQVKSSVIGVFDASGSMGRAWNHAVECWNSLTQHIESKFMITFSSEAQERQPILKKNIDLYNSSSTNICAGFHQLAKVLRNPLVHENVTVIFVSDGGDDYPDTLSKRMFQLKEQVHHKIINFISIGVGDKFPTFVAMKLREIYHNGVASLPPLFLINDVVSASEWITQTQLLTDYVQHKAKIPVTPLVQILPWKKTTNEVSLNSWVYSDEEEITVNNSIVVKKILALTLDEYIDISKGWLGELQLLSIQGGQAKEAAIASLVILDDWRKQFIETDLNSEGKSTFNKRMLLKKQNQIQFAVQIILKEFKLLAKDQILSKLTAEEAAQRLAIGTQIGKYHKNALSLRGITVEDYIAARDKFIELRQKLTLDSTTSDQEVSVISLQNQRDVFLEEDLIKGLEECSSQYDLVENFPVIGHGIEIKRNNGAMINPFMVRVIGMARHHKVVDTVSLQTAGNLLEMKIGSDQVEKINAVIPLFSKRDSGLKPLITSKLFHILMTFNVMGNADTCFENAYFAILASTCLHLITSPPSEWQKDMLDLIGSTIEIVSAWQDEFKNYATALIENPRTAMVTENPSITTKCEDLSKPICVLFYLVWAKVLVEQEKIQEILKSIYAEAVGRAYPNDASILDFFKVEIPNGYTSLSFEAEEKSVLESFTDITRLYTQYELKSEIEVRVSNLKFELGEDIRAELSLEQCQFLQFGKLSIKNLNKVHMFFLPESPLPNETILTTLISHADKLHSSYERNISEIDTNVEQILHKIVKEKVIPKTTSNRMVDNIYKQLLQQFQENSFKVHLCAEPMTKEDVAKYCKEACIDPSEFQFNNTSNLLKNACMAKKCPFFMVPSKSLSQHLESHIGRCPALHKTIKLNLLKTAGEIFEMIFTGECLNKINGVKPLGLITENLKNKMNEYREQYLLLINQIKEKYNNIDFKKDDETHAEFSTARETKIKKP